MIGNVPTQRNNICFSGMYLLKGKPDDVWKVYDYIKVNNQRWLMKYPTDYAILPSYKKGIIVLTEEDINRKNQPEFLKEKLKTMTTVLASDIAKFIDSVNLKIIDNRKLRFLDCSSGEYEKRVTKRIKDMTLRVYQNNSKTINGSKRFKDNIYSIKFDEKMPLVEGLQKLVDLREEFYKDKTFSLGFSCKSDCDLFIKAINKSEKLSRLEMKGMKGNGASNMAIELTNDQVLKLSTVPNFPEKVESFELPILHKEIIEVCDTNGEVKKAYCYIQPKGKNYNEIVITQEMVDSIVSEMKKQGFEPEGDLVPGNIVIYKGKAYISDTDECIKDRKLVA